MRARARLTRALPSLPRCSHRILVSNGSLQESFRRLSPSVAPGKGFSQSPAPAAASARSHRPLAATCIRLPQRRGERKLNRRSENDTQRTDHILLLADLRREASSAFLSGAPPVSYEPRQRPKHLPRCVPAAAARSAVVLSTSA